jgi:hypothetical protein
MSGIFGGSKSKSTQESGNRNLGLINQQYAGQMQQGNDAVSQVMALLGGDRSGLQAFQDATGFNPMAERMSRGVTGNAAAGGLLRSGATGSALTQLGVDLQNQSAGDYIQRLLGVGEMGLGAGQLVTSAGQYSKGESTQKSKPGIGGLIGQGLSGIAALKTGGLSKAITG